MIELVTFLALWRTPDATGLACASCHSPDGIELRAYRFTRADIDRRASRHLTGASRAELVKTILQSGGLPPDDPDKPKRCEPVVSFVPLWFPSASIRAIRGPSLPSFDPRIDRPLQPGGKVLPGATPQERDAAFERQLPTFLPTLVGPPIRSIEEAKMARDELLAVDLRRLPIGIELNRLSEDAFHGPKHATLAGWIPDTPIPLTPARRTAEDAYLADPTDENLRAIDAEAAKMKPKTTAEALSKAKYRSLLRLQHILRTGRFVTETHPGPDSNPMWEVAEIARTSGASTLQEMGYPPEVVRQKTIDPKRQLKDLRLPWYWLGWMADPSLLHSRLDHETRRGDYFAKTLLDDGPYPAHLAFCMARKIVEQAKERRFEVQFSFLVLGGGAEKLPKSSFKANAFRMAMWLLLDDIQKNGEPVRPHSQLLQVRLMGAYLRRIGEPEPDLTRRLTAVLEPLDGKRGRS